MSGGGLEGASDLVISCCCIVLFRVEEDSNKSNEFHKTARFPCFPFLEILRNFCALLEVFLSSDDARSTLRFYPLPFFSFSLCFLFFLFFFFSVKSY